MKIEVSKKEGHYGIIENKKLVVPYCHLSKEDAIGEWVYFESLNIKEHFLSHVKEQEQIEEIKNNLLLHGTYKN